MFKDFSILILCGAIIVLTVRFLLVPGIVKIGAAFKFSAKTRGQMIGYATSIPEFTVLVAGAIAGVFDAGLWNIAASNIINWVLFLVTVFAFRQQIDLRKKWFIDEIFFVLLSVAIPLLLLYMQIKTGFIPAIGLLVFFFTYRILDKLLNQAGKPAPLPPGSKNGTLWGGLLFLVFSLVLIILAGRFLGTSAGLLITQLGVPAWAIGWILGFVTSISEFVSFIEIYRIHKPKHRPGYSKDTQEAIDALVTSNISNIGLVLPLGMIIYMLLS